MTGHRFDPSILREYDVRGVVGQTLSATDAEALGRAFGSIVRGQGGTRVALGYDGRISSPELEEAVALHVAQLQKSVRVALDDAAGRRVGVVARRAAGAEEVSRLVVRQ